MDVKLAEALAAFKTGRTAEAEALLRDIARRRPNDLDALRMIGVICGLTGRHEEALSQFDRALRLNRKQPNILYNRASSLLALDRNTEALDCIDGALKMAGPQADAYASRAVALRRLKRPKEAVESCDIAIKLNPFSVNALINKANALADLGRNQEALDAYDASVRLQPQAEAWMGRGRVLKRLKRDEEALAAFANAYALDPTLPYLPGEILDLKMRLANWESLERHRQLVFDDLRRGRRATPPGYILSSPSTAEQHRLAAEIFVRDKYPNVAPPLPRSTLAKKPKITIGYFSSDFRAHVISYLAAGLFEHHDRGEFTVIGFDYSGEPADEYTHRIAAGVDRFIDVSSKSDEEVAALSRSLDVDIAVDLTGLTAQGRLGIFARRAAPVQATYLGYPGTTGCPFIDFVIADEVTIPVAHSKFFTEKPIRIPVSFQINDSRRPPVGPRPNRADYGLPDDAFVFCSFNTGYKLTPDLFAIWMRLLQRVEGSVLWHVTDTETFIRNLRRYAVEHGVSPERLIFAERVGRPEHLARQQCADLALDTFYHNGMTTTSDLLWAGVPVITRLGDTFAARVAASLLEAIDLPDLVARTSDDYEERAFRLATTPGALASVKQRLEQNRGSRSLFNTAETTRRLEAAYRTMLGREGEA